MRTFIILLMLLAVVIKIIAFVKKKKPRLLVISVLVIVIGIFFLSGFRFTAIDTIPGNVEQISSYDTVYGKAILFEDVNDKTFGLARVKQRLGIIYYYDGGTFGNDIEENKPFEVTGYGTVYEKEGFIVGVKTAENSSIKYIVIGGHSENTPPSIPYDFSMNTVKEQPDNYHIKKIINNFAFFVLDGYSEDTWTIRGLNEDGNLVADKLFGGDIRFISW
ncbi:hypothetical protein BKP45_08605 [Anaerobacillus alkalidiazotrophicus]|uniref:Uncharacterized protein n=1 Tax=Anaerobacillus alkalidiazotrophicus TaxID=472963 RepID=A0A1S2M7S9_9BACI|nr:hypothetical protein [Anaerobacillus alkalidiazotrophicus]OIJ20694.1 hypothetical protein BKP45_08605 [Anaerobacillus alkalidiazotrophicus]